MRVMRVALTLLALAAAFLGAPAASPLIPSGELRAEDSSKLMYLKIGPHNLCYQTCASGAYCCQKVYLPK